MDFDNFDDDQNDDSLVKKTCTVDKVNCTMHWWFSFGRFDHNGA